MSKRSRKNDLFVLSAVDNAMTYNRYFLRLSELAISRFKWNNLPDTIDERFLELILFAQGHAVFFKDEVMGFLALQGAIGGAFNQYRIPTTRRAIADNGYQKSLTEKDSIIIYDNYLHTNTSPMIEQFARRLANFDRIIDVNINAQKTPMLIICDENERLTMENLYMRYDGNQPFIFGDKGLNKNGVTVLKTDAPYNADRIYELKTQVWNEALTYLGISNTNVVKKERLISDEVTRNNAGTIASRHSPLEARRQAADKINRMFGLDITVDYRDDYQIIDNGKPEESEVLDVE